MNLRYYYIAAITVLSIFIIFLVSSLDSQKFGKNHAKKIYFIDNISVAHKQIIKNFNALHTGEIEVIPINTPFEKFTTNERKELLIRSLRNSSDRIDIFAVDIIWVTRFSKWAEPLEKYFSQNDLERLTKQALSTCFVNGKLVASPFMMDPSVLFYRKDLLDRLKDHESIEKQLENSMTWTEFISLCKRLNYKKWIYLFPADQYEGLICSYSELVLQQDKDFFKSKLDFTKPPSLLAVKLLSGLTNKDNISPKEISNYRESDINSNFLNKNIPFIRGWNAYYSFNKTSPEYLAQDIQIGKARMPHIKNGKIGATIGGWNFMLAKNSNHKKEAMEFIKYTLSEESQKILYEYSTLLPVIKEVYIDSSFVKNYPMISWDKQILNEGIFRPQIKKYTLVSDILSKYINLSIRNKFTPEQAMERVQSALISDRVISE